jgi:hypothetical protein
LVTNFTPDSWELPDELPQRAGRWVGQFTVVEIAMPPERIQRGIMERGASVYPRFHYAIQPLSFRYESDRSVFENDLEEKWLNVYDEKTGELVGQNSLFGQFRTALTKLGYRIKTPADCKALIGKAFEFETRKVDFSRGEDSTETGIARSASYVAIPLTEVDLSTYRPPSPLPVRKRPFRREQASAATIERQMANAQINDAVVAPKLLKALAGKGPSEWTMALISTQDPDLVRQPFLTEASAGTIRTRLAAYGAKFDADGKVIA